MFINIRKGFKNQKNIFFHIFINKLNKFDKKNK